MPEFAYKARNHAGSDVIGTITAASRREALCALGDRELFPMSVETSLPARIAWRRKGRIKTQLLATTLTQMADLLQSGVPMLRSLDVLAEQALHPALAEVLCDVRNQVAEGTPLDDAMARHPQVFSELTISMVRAGSEGAFLEDALKRTADFLEKQEELRGRVVGAMTYPVILATAGFVVTVVLIVFFVPKFAPLFARLEEQGGLPIATVALLWISGVLGRYGVFVAAAVAAAVVFARRRLRTEEGRLFTDRTKLKIPIAGKIFMGYAISRFCRVLGTLLRNGVPLLKSLEISSDSTGNRVLSRAIRNSADNVSSGETLARPLAESGLIPRPVMAMISVAEESNNLDHVLIQIADGIDRQTSRQLDLMVRLLEPLTLLIMASAILFVLIALLLPVFQMSSTVT
ncbi:MAG TPA: type II secretion system F family protein [Pirellulales bacterium]|jgi:general secretion pathway protein F/type IV pilus assembly protein PilC|nr:type II secretion system F family protein [Pirellulales bacterium]